MASLTRRSDEASTALRSSRGLEGLLLGTPPSPIVEAASKGAEEMSKLRWRRGRTEGFGTKGTKRRPVPPEEKRRGGVHSEEAVRARRDGRQSNSEIPFAKAAKTLDGEGTQSEAAPLSEICMECPTVIPLSCVECCNITNLPKEYSLMLAVRG